MSERNSIGSTNQTIYIDRRYWPSPSLTVEKQKVKCPSCPHVGGCLDRCGWAAR